MADKKRPGLLKRAQNQMKTPDRIRKHTVRAAVRKLSKSTQSPRPKSTKPKAPSKRNPTNLASRSYVKTKGGDYPVYKKKSAMAGSFRTAFRNAMKAKSAGKSVKGFYNAKTNVFTWKGRKYKAVLAKPAAKKKKK